MGIVVVPLLLVLLAIAWAVGRGMRRWSGSRIIGVLSFVAALVLPWTNTLIGLYVANDFYASSQLIPTEPIFSPGLLLDDARDDDDPELGSFLGPSMGLEFVEVEYTKSPPGPVPFVPGFYRFRLSPEQPAYCANRGTSGKPGGVYSSGGICYAYVRDERPVSAYAFRTDPGTPLRSNVSYLCQRLIELKSRADVARSCVVNAHVGGNGDDGVLVKHFESQSGFGVLAFLRPRPRVEN